MKDRFVNVELEKRLLSLLLSEELGFKSINFVFTSINYDHFTTHLHKLLFGFVINSFNNYCEANKENNFTKLPVIICEEVVNAVKSDTKLSIEDKDSVQEFVQEMLYLPDVPEHLNYYVSELNEYKKLRILKNTLHAANDALVVDNEKSASDVAINIQQIMSDGLIDARKSDQSIDLLGTYAEQAHANAIKNKNRSNNSITGVDTGIASLNTITSGLQPSDFVVVAARPSMGKSALAVHMALQAAMSPEALVNKGNYGIVFFTLEMTAIQLAQRFLANYSNIPITKINTGRGLENNELSDLKQAVNKFKTFDVFIDECNTNYIDDIRNKVLRLKEKIDLKLVIIDYLQLLSAHNHSYNRQNEIAYISRTLKRLAVEVNVPIVALSQLSREVEKRPDKNPIMSDLRESGAIEQDADIVIFLYRDDYYHPSKVNNEKSCSEIELKIAKHRNGPLGIFNLKFWKAVSAFSDENSSYNKVNLQTPKIIAKYN